MKNKLILFALLCTFLVGSSFKLVTDRWDIIGQKQANWGPDVDILKVNGNDIYKAVKIRVADAGLDMMDFNIVFENGERMNVPIQKNFKQGEESRVIDLPGKRRRIDRFEFLYDTKGVMNGKANVIILGRK